MQQVQGRRSTSVFCFAHLQSALWSCCFGRSFPTLRLGMKWELYSLGLASIQLTSTIPSTRAVYTKHSTLQNVENIIKSSLSCSIESEIERVTTCDNMRQLCPMYSNVALAREVTEIRPSCPSSLWSNWCPFESSQCLASYTALHPERTSHGKNMKKTWKNVSYSSYSYVILNDGWSIQEVHCAWSPQQFKPRTVSVQAKEGSTTLWQFRQAAQHTVAVVHENGTISLSSDIWGNYCMPRSCILFAGGLVKCYTDLLIWDLTLVGWHCSEINKHDQDLCSTARLLCRLALYKWGPAILSSCARCSWDCSISFRACQWEVVFLGAMNCNDRYDVFVVWRCLKVENSAGTILNQRAQGLASAVEVSWTKMRDNTMTIRKISPS